MKLSAYAVCIWLLLFAFCMVAIGPGWVGGPLMAQDRHFAQVQSRGKFHDGNNAPGYVTFNTPSGWTRAGKPYAIHTPSGNDSIVMPFTDIQGESHTIVIEHPQDPMSADVVLDPPGVQP